MCVYLGAIFQVSKSPPRLGLILTDKETNIVCANYFKFIKFWKTQFMRNGVFRNSYESRTLYRRYDFSNQSRDIM